MTATIVTRVPASRFARCIFGLFPEKVVSSGQEKALTTPHQGGLEGRATRPCGPAEGRSAPGKGACKLVLEGVTLSWNHSTHLKSHHTIMHVYNPPFRRSVANMAHTSGLVRPMNLLTDLSDRNRRRNRACRSKTKPLSEHITDSPRPPSSFFSYNYGQPDKAAMDIMSKILSLSLKYNYATFIDCQGINPESL